MDALSAQVQSAVEAGDYGQLAPVLDAAELQEPSGSFPPQWPFALHLLAHIYASNLEDARFLYKRIPEEVKQASEELRKGFELLQRLWTKDYEKLWGTLEYGGWSDQVQPLVVAIGAKLRSDMLRLASQAYSSLSPAKLAALLGVGEAEAVQLAEGQGWEREAATGLLTVKTQQTPVQLQGKASEQQLQRLAEYVVHLET